MKAVILAGGEGRRLRPLTDDRPKPLLEIGGKPIIEWQIMWMKHFGFDSFTILAGYMKDKLVTRLGTGSKLGVDINFSIEEEPLGTGGAIKGIENTFRKEEKFLIANGDIITNIDLGRLFDLGGSVCNIALVPLKSTFGVVNTNMEKVVGFEEKPIIKEHWLNAGMYIASNRIFDYLPNKGSIEKETFPKLAAAGLLNSVKFDNNYWRSIDSYKDFEEANSDLEEYNQKNWIF
jgi:mannose-1-phosphate guanylyltransferase